MTLSSLLATPFKRHRIFSLVALSGLAAAGITAAYSRLEFHSIEAALYNAQATLGWLNSADPRITLITVDDSSLAHFDELSPLSVRTHTRILEAIARHQPMAVGYTLNFVRSSELDSEPSRMKALQDFTSLASRLSQRGVPVVLGTSYDVTGEILPPFPLSTLPHGLSVIHRDGAGLSGDKVSRRALLQLDERPSFSMVLAQKSSLRAPSRPVRGGFKVPEIQAKYFSFRYHGNPNRAYPRIPVQKILNGELPERALEGKILLIGSTLHDEPSDFAVTPYSQQSWASPKLAIQATILDSIISDDGLIRTGNRVRNLLSWLCTALVIFFVLSTSPWVGVLASLGVAGLLSTLALVVYQRPIGLWISSAHPLIGMMTAYYLSVPYRLLQEHQQRSKLQRSHEVLVQVEELKTNFLSLVTHDLKTPVARIQGLAEVLLMKAATRLVERDVQTLHHIVESTEELNRFISAILELAKIESAELKPRFESKDLNRLVEKAVDSFKAPARAKHCRLEVELEPLFPIQMDPSLIQKVIHNLIDNAIKYSPPSSVIHVRTRELEGFVEFSVRDEGVGLSEEEQELLFQKFYRAKNSATSQVGGSGLGLYLCKYFIEAHSGSIEVTSHPGQGSAFTIRLPIEQAKKISMDSPGLKTLLSNSSSATTGVRA